MTSFNGLGSISNISILFVVVIVALLCGEILVYSASIETQDGFFSMIVGLLSGSLTSPPAFSAPKATAAVE